MGSLLYDGLTLPEVGRGLLDFDLVFIKIKKKEDPYEACSDEEDNSEEDASMKFPEMGATWEPVVHAFAGSSHQEVCARMGDWADENGYVLSRRGDKKKGQAYFYCHKVGRQKQPNPGSFPRIVGRCQHMHRSQRRIVVPSMCTFLAGWMACVRCGP